MGKYEDALKAGLTDDDIVNSFTPKVKSAIDSVGVDETRNYLKTSMQLPDHIVSKLLGEQKQVDTTLPPIPTEAPAAPNMDNYKQPMQEPSILDKVKDTVSALGTEISQVTAPMIESAKQGAGAIAGTTGELIKLAERGVNYFTDSTSTPLSDPLIKFSDDIDAQWKAKYGDKFNAQKLIADIATPMGPAMTAFKDAKTLTGVFKNIINPQNAASVLTGMAVVDGQLRRDNVPNAEAWALGFGTVQALFPVAGAGVDAVTAYRTRNYIDKVLQIPRETIDKELATISKFRDLSNLSDIEKDVLVVSKINPQAAMGLQKVMLSNDKYAATIYRELANKAEQVDNITTAKPEDVLMTFGDTAKQIKAQYGHMDEALVNNIGTQVFNIDRVKLGIESSKEDLLANLVGRDKSLSTLNKIMRSEPTNYSELAELTSDVGKRIRQLPEGDTSRLALENTYKNLRNSIEEQVTNYSTKEGKDIITATIKGQNEAYAFLKGELEKSGIYQDTLLKNVNSKTAIGSIIRNITASSSPELTQKFINVLNKVKETTSPELVDQGIIKSIVEAVETKLPGGGKTHDFVKLSENLDSIPEGIITSPEAKLMMETLQDISAFSKFDVQQGKAITRFGGKEAQELSGTISSTLGFNLQLKISQAMAKYGLRLVNDASAYAVTVSKVLDKKKDLPTVIGQFRNAFAYNLPKDDLSQLDKYLKQTSDIYNESTLAHNISVSNPALSNNDASYWQQLSSLYTTNELKDMFRIRHAEIGVDNLPYFQTSDNVYFRWDKVDDTTRNISDISKGFAEYFPGKKIVRGETTDLTGDIWTISKQDQFTPNSLSQQLIAVADGKLQGAKYQVSREVPNLLDADYQILSNDLKWHLEKAGLPADRLNQMRIVSRDSAENATFYSFGPNVTLKRTPNTDKPGNFMWEALTTGFKQESSEGGKWYEGVFNWVNSLGPQHQYKASEGLTTINRYRNSVNQMNHALQSGNYSRNFIPSSAQVGLENVPRAERNWEAVSNGLVNELNTLLPDGINIKTITDEQIKNVVSMWHTGNIYKRTMQGSTGENTLKIVRTLANHLDKGPWTEGQAKAFVKHSEDILDNIPRPLEPAITSNLSLGERLGQANTVSELDSILNDAINVGLIASSEARELYSTYRTKLTGGNNGL